MINRKKTLKTFILLAIVLFMGFILYKMFKDSYKGIISSLSETNPKIFIFMVLLGNCYYIIDAFVYKKFLEKNGYKLGFIKCLAVGYMSIFFNVTSFGAGIKPGQILYLHKNGVDTGEACSITMMPYIFHKTVIVVYAVIMLLFNNWFVCKNFVHTFGYIYAGVGLSIGIIVFMILLCASAWFHKLVCKLLDATLGRTRFKESNEKIKIQIGLLRDATQKIIKKPSAWLTMGFIEIIKMSCWYLIPTLALYALGGNMGGVTIAEALTITAIMQLLMGVVPTSGAVGSLEVVFSMLFAVVFGKVTAGSCMILYRLATYYLPFLFSLALMICVGKDLNKDNSNGSKPVELDYSKVE